MNPEIRTLDWAQLQSRQPAFPSKDQFNQCRNGVAIDDERNGLLLMLVTHLNETRFLNYRKFGSTTRVLPAGQAPSAD